MQVDLYNGPKTVVVVVVVVVVPTAVIMAIFLVNMVSLYPEGNIWG